MTVVGEVSVPVIPMGGTFAADLIRITDEAASKAGTSAGRQFVATFQRSIRAGKSDFVGTFAGSAESAARAGQAAGRSFIAGMREATRTGVPGGNSLLQSLATPPEAEAQGLATGKAYSRGVILGSAESRRIQGLIPSLAGEAEASGAGVAAGRAYSRGMTAGTVEGNSRSFLPSFRRSLQDGEAAAAGSGGRAGRAFALAMRGGLLPLAAIITTIFSVKEAATFDQHLALIQTQAGDTAAEVKKIGESALQLAPQVGQAPTKLADAYYHAASAGFTFADQQRLVAAASRGAAIGQSDLEKTTQALIATTRSGIKGFSGMDDAMNVLIRTVGIGDIRMPQLVAALSTGIIPAAKSAGLSIEDVSAALAVLGDNVVPPQQAATRLRMTFALLAAPSDKAKSQLKEIGLNADSLANDMQKPQGLLVAIDDLHTHLDKAFPASGGHKLSIQEQKVALLEYTGSLKTAGVSGTALTKAQHDMADSLANGTSNLVKQNQALEHIFGGGRTSGTFLTLFEETDLLRQKYHLLGDATSRAAFAQQAWEKQSSLLSQKWKDFTAGLQVGIIRIGHGLTPAVSGLLGWLQQVPHYLGPVVHDMQAVWQAAGDVVSALKPVGSFVAQAFGGAVMLVIDAFGAALRDVVAPALHGVAAGFRFLDDNKGIVIGLGAAVATYLAPALAVVTAELISDAWAGFAAVLLEITAGFGEAAGAAALFVASNPALLGLAAAVGIIAGAMTLFGGSTTQAKVDVDALNGSLKTLVTTGNAGDFEQSVLGQLAKWDVGSHHQTGIDYLQKYGVAAGDLASNLANPANAGAWAQFQKDLGLAPAGQSLWNNGIAGIANYTKALHDANPVVRQFATLFSQLADPKNHVNQDTVVKLEHAFDSLTGGIDRQRVQILETQNAQKGYGQTFVDTSDAASQALLTVVKTAGTGAEAVSKIDNALRISTGDALNMIQTIEGWNDTSAQSQSQLASAQQSLASSQQDVASKQQAYNTQLAQFGASSPQAKAAYGDLQKAISSVSSAQDQVNKAQPPSTDSILKKLGLDDATLKQLNGATQKLLAEGITGPALSQLLSLNDPRALLAFSQGGKGVVSQLNKAVSQFFDDSGPNSFASLQTAWKAHGEAGVESWVGGVRALAGKVQDTYNEVFAQNAGRVFGAVEDLARTAGSKLPPGVAQGMESKSLEFLDSLSSVFTGPQQSAVRALERYALTGGAGVGQNLANSIASKKPIIISKQTAIKDGLNAETRKILDQIGIHIRVDDQASPKIKAIAQELGQLASAAATAGVAAVGISSSGDHPIRSYAGGFIVGPGDGTSDSILGIDRYTGSPTSWVSTGEFVTNAKSTAKYRRELEAINADRLAAGGPVNPSDAGRPVFDTSRTYNVEALLDRMQKKIDSLGGGRLLTAAAKYLGTPYLLGGNPYVDPFASDCSGLVDRAMADIGQRLPGRPLTFDLVNMGDHVGGLDVARPGDLLMMNYGEGGIPGPGHVGIYASPNRMLHDPLPGGHVEYINIWETPGDIRRLAGTTGIRGSANGFAVVAGAPQKIAAQMLADRGQGAEFPLLNEIVTEESGWNVTIQNSIGAYGLPQALPGNKMASAGADWRTSAATQLRWMLGYVDQVYGGLPQAVAFHRAHGWYDQGGIVPPGLSMVMNGTNQPEAILTGSQWESLSKLANGGIVSGLMGSLPQLAAGGAPSSATLADLHKAAAAANREISQYLHALASAAKKQAEAQQRAAASYLRALAKQQAQIDKFGIGLVKSTEAGPLKAGQAAIAQGVKEGNGPLQKYIAILLQHAEAGLYGAGLSAVRDGKLTGNELTSVQSWAKQVTSLTATLTKLNTVNQTLIDSLKTFVQSQQQFRDSLVQSISQGSGFSDILKTSGTPADVRSILSSKMADLKSYTTKMGKLIDKGFSPAIVRDISGDGIENASLYADVLLQSSAADVKGINKGFGDLTSATAFTANAITSRTLGTIAGITQPGAVNYINQAIFTTSEAGSLSAASSDLLISKAEFTQRTGIAKKMDGGGYLYPGRTVIDHAGRGRERVLNEAETADYDSRRAQPVHVEHTTNIYGVDTATAHAMSGRELVLALNKAGVGRG